MSDPTRTRTTADPDAWDDATIRQEVAFCLSPSGRLRRDDREVAFALEIKRLRDKLETVERCWEMYAVKMVQQALSS